MTSSKYELTVRNGTVAACGGVFVGDLGVIDGRIAAIGKDLPAGKEDVDAAGLIVVPGAIDPHTHFARLSRRSEMQSVDDYETGTRAALLGGITTILNCAFQEPGETVDQALERELSLAADSHVDYSFHVAVTDLSVPGTVEALGTLSDNGLTSVKTFTSLPPYMLGKPELLSVLDTAAREGLTVNVHVEDHAVCSHMTDRLLASGHRSVSNFPAARPSIAEALAVREMAAYARATDTTLYFIYLSSRAGLAEATRARREGSRAFVETRPLYLFLDDSRYALPGAEANKYVCLPPLRSLDDQEALWDGLRDGEIHTYATDHVAWTSAQKGLEERPFNEVPAGVSNVQTSIGMLYAEGVGKGRITLSRFVELVATNPAKIFHLWPKKGSISVGADADIVVIDPQKRIQVTREAMVSNADFDLFEGQSFVGWPVITIARGEVVTRGGEVLSSPGRGRFLARSLS